MYFSRTTRGAGAEAPELLAPLRNDKLDEFTSQIGVRRAPEKPNGIGPRR